MWLSVTIQKRNAFRQQNMPAVFFSNGKGIEVRIDTYAAGRELLESGREYDLYLLDVLMPGMSGIDTDRPWRKTRIIRWWYSSHRPWNQLWRDYRVEAAGFILKPVEEENFWSTMERVVRRRLGLKKAVLSVVHNRVNVELPWSAWPGLRTGFTVFL